MANSFNALSPGEAERLAMLIEEAGEVIQAATKTLRHGYASKHPRCLAPQCPDNRDMLAQELDDFMAVYTAMIDAGDVRSFGSEQRTRVIWNKKQNYTHHQREEVKHG